MEYIGAVFGDRILRAVISNPRLKSAECKKVEIRLTDIGGREVYQIERFTEKQAFHENVETEQICAVVENIIESGGFRQFDGWSGDSYYLIKISKKGKASLVKKKIAEGKYKKAAGNNRDKKYLLRQNTSIPPLVDLGVFTKDGHVVSAMYDKYKQINRFVEIIDDVIAKSPGEEIRILDFGCGKFYLTFILYYYLTEIKGINPQIVGLDLKKDVIEKCNALAEKYGYSGLSFKVGDINGYKPDFKPHMVITLHACDTATDYALYNAVAWGAETIVSVPCCQHELNGQIKTDRFSALTDYGLIKERFSALATDAIRGKLLEWQGYKVQMLEFVDFEHSPKNLLIRAVKGKTSESKRNAARQKADELIKEFNFSPTLDKLLKEEN